VGSLVAPALYKDIDLVDFVSPEAIAERVEAVFDRYWFRSDCFKKSASPSKFWINL
jgi:hypothetical protein